MIIIKISEEFTPAPGARNIDEGASSGEEFLNSKLEPTFKTALEKKDTILVDLDNTEGYATSFLEEAFGGLSRKYGAEIVSKIIHFKSDDEPLLISEINTYIKEANEKRN